MEMPTGSFTIGTSTATSADAVISRMDMSLGGYQLSGNLQELYESSFEIPTNSLIALRFS